MTRAPPDDPTLFRSAKNSGSLADAFIVTRASGPCVKHSNCK
jgi:hypothetical protein